MNRMEEYHALQTELEQTVPALEQTFQRAEQRLRRRNRRITRAWGSLCAVFALFVVLVNFCAPVAYACSKVPGLRELAEAVTFSRSLTDAVNNEYVQPISLTQTQNGITASVEYLIVDQKQVNVFFRLTGEGYETLDADVDFLQEDGQRIGSCTWGPNDHDVPSGKLQSATLEMLEGDLPGNLQLALDVWERQTPDRVTEAAPPTREDALFDTSDYQEPDYAAHFRFQLSFDPTFTAPAKIYPVNRTVELEGKEITIQQMEVYPTHLRVLVEDHPENDAKLQRLFFYIETDWGMKFEAETNGMISFSAGGSNVTTYRADSTYFYKADHLRIVITAAEWLNRDMETVYVNLVTGETGPLPEDLSFVSAEKQEGGWIVTFKAKQRKWYSDADVVAHQLFQQTYLGADGTEYEVRSWSSGGSSALPQEEWDTHFTEQFPLKGYYEDEVWLKPHYSHVWQAENEIVVVVQ